MRVFSLAIICLLSGCASIQDLTHAMCLPAGVPGTVVLKREAYLCHFQNEKEISLWNSQYQYGSGVDDFDRMVMHSPPPLKVLPSGTRLTIERITRETHFDNSPNSIYARGVAHSGGRDLRFSYLWGSNNKIQQAPWETEAYAPRDFSRSILCGG
jgi:hypothetical protein